MARVSIFIDGFNVYYSIKRSCPQYKWLNYRKLAERFITPADHIAKIFLFTAYPLNSPKKYLRHQLFLKASESVGIKVVLGAHKERDKECPLCHRTYKAYEEKMTDVNIAVTLIGEGIKNQYDTALLVSGDNDLTPAVIMFRDLFDSQNKEIGVILPIGIRGRNTNRLKEYAHYRRKINMAALEASQFPQVVTLKSGRQITRPGAWQRP